MCLQIVRNHIVQGLVYGSDLEDDLVGTTIGGTKLRSNVYLAENDEWKEVVVSVQFSDMYFSGRENLPFWVQIMFSAKFQRKTINGAILRKVDLTGSNGVVHIIDRVLYPESDHCSTFFSPFLPEFHRFCRELSPHLLPDHDLCRKC